MAFTTNDYSKILDSFKEQSDEQYLQFSSSLIPTGTEFKYGIRIPMIRTMAKEICKNDPLGFLKVCRNDSFEELMLQAIVVAGMKAPIETKLFYVEKFVPLIDNWSICDSFCTTFKPKKTERDIVYDFVLPYLDGEREYFVRFGVIMLLANYIDDEHIDDILSLMPKIHHDAYYVKMGIAWNLSVCFVKFRDKTLELLKKQCLDKFTQNKTIQKIRESFRVEKSDKEMILQYKL